MKKLLFCVAMLFAFGCVGFAQTSAGAGTREVNVYFMYIGTDGTESLVRPLKRRVPSAAPLHPAIAAMLVDPNIAEQQQGYVSTSYGDMKLDSVKLSKGRARIDFSRVIRSDYNPGDLQTLYFEEAVIKTAKQFPGVKKVVVCVNGIKEFGIGMTVDAPTPCPKEK